MCPNRIITCSRTTHTYLLCGLSSLPYISDFSLGSLKSQSHQAWMKTLYLEILVEQASRNICPIQGWPQIHIAPEPPLDLLRGLPCRRQALVLYCLGPEVLGQGHRPLLHQQRPVQPSLASSMLPAFMLSQLVASTSPYLE